MANTPVIFYSWQSDLPNNTNRGLIGAALEKASKELSAELDEVIRVDADTQGESGSPDIAATILAKIEKATVVVADVSIIGATTIFASDPAKTRLSPNANVMFELGYAKRAIGADRVIMVCNTVYGRIEDLPFDIRGRSVLAYTAKPEQETKADARNELAARLKRSIAAALLAANANEKAVDPKALEEAQQSQLEDFEALRNRLNDAVLGANPVSLVPDEPLLVVRVVPERSLDGMPHVNLKFAENNLVRELAPLGASGWSWEHDVDSLSGVHSRDKPQFTYTRLYETGTIEVVVTIGQELNDIAYRAPRILRQVLPIIGKVDVGDRCFVSVDVLRAKGTKVSTKGAFWLGPGEIARPIAKDVLSPGAVSIEASKVSDLPAMLRPMLDWLWRASGCKDCWLFDEQGTMRSV
jgi:hypothetical protein